LAKAQHFVVARRQLFDLGFTTKAIEHRIAIGRLHPVYRGVYAVGRRELTQEGGWMAAVLACGDGAVLSHRTAAALMAFWPRRGSVLVHISFAANVRRAVRGITTHRRQPSLQIGTFNRLPCTSPLQTLVDIATELTSNELEAALNDAVKADHMDPDTLRAGLSSLPRQPGLGALRRLVDRHEFRLTDSELERQFLRIVARAGVPLPDTQERFPSGGVDFHWADLGLVVETDGRRFHRTATDQTRDLRRDQVHAVAGRTSLRFSHWQVYREPAEVTRVLSLVASQRRAEVLG
jgi:very-short-patch-repair endonuclease